MFEFCRHRVGNFTLLWERFRAMFAIILPNYKTGKAAEPKPSRPGGISVKRAVTVTALFHLAKL
jgi:hypothetical protein